MDERWGEVASYMHIGQHSAADYRYVVATTKPATKKESAELLNELRQVGYDNIRIVKRAKIQSCATQGQRTANAIGPNGNPFTSISTICSTTKESKKSMTKNYNVKTILESLKGDVENGKISIREAAVELHKAGWTNFIDIDATRKLLKFPHNSMKHSKR